MKRFNGKICYLVLPLALLCLLAVIGGWLLVSANAPAQAKDCVQVLDAEAQTVAKLDNNEARNFMSNMEEMAQNTDDGFFKRLPSDAKLLYRYRIQHRGRILGLETIELKVYANYPLMTVSGVPLVSHLTWTVDDKTYKFLANPHHKLAIEKG